MEQSFEADARGFILGTNVSTKQAVWPGMPRLCSRALLLGGWEPMRRM